MKVVINRKYGGFGLSLAAQKRYLEKQGKECFFYSLGLSGEISNTKTDENSKNLFTVAYTKDFGESTKGKDTKEFYFDCNRVSRNDPVLVAVVEEMGEAVNDRCSQLEIVEIPDDVEFEIDDYDGMESVEEKHRSWY